MGLQIEEVVDVFGKGKFDLVPLTKTKKKGTEKISWCGICVICEEIHENERTTESVTVLLNYVWYSVLVEFGWARV